MIISLLIDFLICMVAFGPAGGARLCSFILTFSTSCRGNFLGALALFPGWVLLRFRTRISPCPAWNQRCWAGGSCSTSCCSPSRRRTSSRVGPVCSRTSGRLWRTWPGREGASWGSWRKSRRCCRCRRWVKFWNLGLLKRGQNQKYRESYHMFTLGLMLKSSKVNDFKLPLKR